LQQEDSPGEVITALNRLEQVCNEALATVKLSNWEVPIQ
jgi:hypothetical protein